MKDFEKSDFLKKRNRTGEIFIKTTLNQIKSFEPCTDRWKKLLRSLGKKKADDEPLSIIKVLESSGLENTLWCLRAVVGHEKEKRLYAVWCVRHVQHLITAQIIAALDVSERFANGEVNQQDFIAVREATKFAFLAAASVWSPDASWAAMDAALSSRSVWLAQGGSQMDKTSVDQSQSDQLRKVCIEIEMREISKA